MWMSHPDTPFCPNSPPPPADAGAKSYFEGMKGSMLHAENPFCFNPDAAAPQDPILPRFFYWGYFGLAWHGKRKLCKRENVVR